MGLLFALSLLYLLVFYLIGLAISCMTHRSATSLIYALFAWALLAIVLPNSISALLNEQANMGEKHAEAHHKAAQVWKEFDQEVTDLARAHGQTKYFPTDMVEHVRITLGRGHCNLRCEALEPTLKETGEQKPRALSIECRRFARASRSSKTSSAAGERLRLQYAQRAWNAKAPLIEDFPRRIQRLERPTPTPPARRCLCPSRQCLRRHQPTRILRLH